jgi:alpha-1,2-mannosyltransferase
MIWNMQSRPAKRAAPASEVGSRSMRLTALFVVLVLVDALFVVLRRVHHRGDFDNSMEFGRRFLRGEYLYRGGLHFPYMPSAAMWFSLFALLPMPLAFVFSYCLAIGSLWLTLRLLRAMVTDRDVHASDRDWLVPIATLVLSAHFIIRDLDDGGPNIFLLAVLTAAIFLAWEERRLMSALCFGFAAAIKATTGIFIPFLLWKRQWKMAAYTIAATGLWISLPITRMGPSKWWFHQREWFGSALGFTLGYNLAAQQYYGYHDLQNQALRPALIRLLAFDSYLLDVRSSQYVALAFALTLMVAYCWFTRRLYGQRLNINWLVETSALLILGILLAPIAWVQHMVLTLPAIFLIATEWLSHGKLGKTATTGMVMYIVLALVLNRELLGKVAFVTLQGYNIQTFSLLLLLAVLFLIQPIQNPDPIA